VRFAKLASEKAKKDKGVYSIGYREITEELKKTDIAEIWGIGKNTTALLNKYGIRTAYSRQYILLGRLNLLHVINKDIENYHFKFH